MATEILVNGLKALIKDSENKEMDSFTARQKLLEAFDLGTQLALKMTDPLMQKLLNGTILIWREFLDQYEKYNFDVHSCSGIILFTWQQYVDRMKAEEEEKKRREMLTELKKQGKI